MRAGRAIGWLHLSQGSARVGEGLVVDSLVLLVLLVQRSPGATQTA